MQLQVGISARMGQNVKFGLVNVSLTTFIDYAHKKYDKNKESRESQKTSSSFHYDSVRSSQQKISKRLQLFQDQSSYQHHMLKWILYYLIKRGTVLSVQPVGLVSIS